MTVIFCLTYFVRTAGSYRIIIIKHKKKIQGKMEYRKIIHKLLILWKKEDLSTGSTPYTHIQNKQNSEQSLGDNALNTDKILRMRQVAKYLE